MARVPKRGVPYQAPINQCLLHLLVASTTIDDKLIIIDIVIVMVAVVVVRGRGRGRGDSWSSYTQNRESSLPVSSHDRS